MTSYTLDDTEVLDCKSKIDKFEATLESTFTTPNDRHSDFGHDLRAAEQAHSDGKVATRKASRRMNHYWNLKIAKRVAMWEAQVSLGRRLRKAYGDAMERKEVLLDVLMDGQVELGSQEMDALLEEVDATWFEMDVEG